MLPTPRLPPSALPDYPVGSWVHPRPLRNPRPGILPTPVLGSRFQAPTSFLPAIQNPQILFRNPRGRKYGTKCPRTAPYCNNSNSERPNQGKSLMTNKIPLDFRYRTSAAAKTNLDLNMNMHVNITRTSHSNSKSVGDRQMISTKDRWSGVYAPKSVQSVSTMVEQPEGPMWSAPVNNVKLGSNLFNSSAVSNYLDSASHVISESTGFKTPVASKASASANRRDSEYFWVRRSSGRKASAHIKRMTPAYTWISQHEVCKPSQSANRVKSVYTWINPQIASTALVSANRVKPTYFSTQKSTTTNSPYAKNVKPASIGVKQTDAFEAAATYRNMKSISMCDEEQEPSVSMVSAHDNDLQPESWSPRLAASIAPTTTMNLQSVEIKGKTPLQFMTKQSLLNIYEGTSYVEAKQSMAVNEKTLQTKDKQAACTKIGDSESSIQSKANSMFTKRVDNSSTSSREQNDKNVLLKVGNYKVTLLKEKIDSAHKVNSESKSHSELKHSQNSKFVPHDHKILQAEKSESTVTHESIINNSSVEDCRIDIANKSTIKREMETQSVDDVSGEIANFEQMALKMESTDIKLEELDVDTLISDDSQLIFLNRSSLKYEPLEEVVGENCSDHCFGDSYILDDEFLNQSIASSVAFCPVDLSNSHENYHSEILGNFCQNSEQTNCISSDICNVQSSCVSVLKSKNVPAASEKDTDATVFSGFPHKPHTKVTHSDLSDKKANKPHLKVKHSTLRDTKAELSEAELQNELATCSYILLDKVLDTCPLGHALNPLDATLNVCTRVITTICHQCKITVYMKNNKD